MKIFLRLFVGFLVLLIEAVFCILIALLTPILIPVMFLGIAIEKVYITGKEIVG